MQGPNPLVVVASILRSLATVRNPNPEGSGHADGAELASILCAVETGGPRALAASAAHLDALIASMATLDPDGFDRNGSLAYWLDLYNAGALALAARAAASGEASVLRVPGAFSAPFVTVAGERLSLDAVEHAKVRRFADPRIHAALVCGSVSCPTLRPTPYSGTELAATLTDQMRSFLLRGGLEVSAQGDVVRLSKVFSWYGSDFVRPRRMPTFLPASGRRVLASLRPWIDADTLGVLDRSAPKVDYQSYDWGLRCTLG
ncbi:MAG: DUF547 domain-containing protein [Acidimicrobiia bacterium]